jgi:N-acyl homoserine lactone hydrolase
MKQLRKNLTKTSAKFLSNTYSRALALSTLTVFSGLISWPLQAAEGGVSISAIKTAQSAGSLEAMVVDGGDWFSIRKLTHSAILVKHPAGDLLYDTGIGTDISQQMEIFNFFDKQLFAVEEHVPAVNQLRDNGYQMSDLKAIVVGHMHWDHVSGLEDFNGTPVWTTEAALTEARAGKPPGFVQSQFDDPQIRWQFKRFEAKEYMGFALSLDVHGDGSVVLVDISGHADGHIGMFVNLEGGKRYFFIGDTTWALKGVEENSSRPAFVQWLTGVDKDVEKNALVVEHVHKLAKEYPELVIVPAHDERVLETLPRYPEFEH